MEREKEIERKKREEENKAKKERLIKKMFARGFADLKFKKKKE